MGESKTSGVGNTEGGQNYSGCVSARCSEATYAWARQWKKWIARLVLDPQNYDGRQYTGRLCKFLGLGKDPQRPYAGPQSHFRHLLVEVNGDQPATNSAGMGIFVGVCYDIDVETVKIDRNGKPRLPEHWYSVVREIHPTNLAFSSVRTREPYNTRSFNPSTLRTQTTRTTDQHSNTANTPLGNSAEVELAPNLIFKADVE
jgi:hypothetical protein